MIVDPILINDCIKGKNAAIKKLYNSYANLMFGICYRYTGNRSDAEDIMQEGFVKIFRSLESYQGKGSFEGWMKKIMINSALGFLKNKKKYSFIENTENLPDISEDNFILKEENEYEITSDQLINYIAKLPDGYRTLINMYAIENYSHKEIAQELGISENVSRTQLHRAKKMLFEVIKKHEVVKELELQK